jgi:hypothetical protein
MMTMVVRVGRTLDLDQKNVHLRAVLLAFDDEVEVEVEVEVPGSDFGDWPTEMRRSDGACRYRSCYHGPVSPDQRCYQDVPKDGVFALEERAE